MPQEIKITRTDDGRIEVTGPLEDKLLAYGMLDVARDIVKDLHDRVAAKKKSNLVQAPASALSIFGRNGKG